VTVYLVRHANAGSRAKWLADDRLRPLTSQGRYQAADLVDVLGELAIKRILSSPYRRCIETVAPLGAALGLQIEIDDCLAEGPGGPALKLVRSLADESIALCSHGDIIPSVLSSIAVEDGLSLGPDAKCQKASTWILESGGSTDGSFTSVSYIPPPR
jgi:phosphohistidine phosphatase SixA